MIWLIGGTADATRIAKQLLEQQLKIIVSVATEQGRFMCDFISCPIYVGEMDKIGMLAFILKNNIDLLIDASHPFAVNVSKNAIEAAKITGIPYVRYERPHKYYSYAQYAESYDEAIGWIAQKSGNVLITTGTRMLSKYQGIKKKRLYPRVLPTVDSIQACLDFGIPFLQILALNGKVSTELNYQLIKEFNIQHVFSKDSGDSGGLPEKVAAAEQAQIPIYIIKRPTIHFPEYVTEFNELFKRIQLC